ncbi:MAG: hypothetical protein QOE93_1389, partial [Actinomycetota bacterium]|nr:hypothetical protein [Actinomycetota bacterium]
MSAGGSRDHSSKSLEELLALWQAGDTKPYAELRRRVLPMVAGLAHESCARICHHGVRRDCPGAVCDLAYGPVIDDLVDRVLGHPTAWQGHRRARRGLVAAWLESDARRRGVSLSSYVRVVVRRRGGAADATRVWRTALGAATRFRYGLDLIPAGLWAAWEAILDRQDLPAAIRRAVEGLGLDCPEGLDRMLRALFEDAAGAGDDAAFSVPRIARYLAREPGATLPPMEDVRVAAALVDALVAVTAPRWAERYLEIARRATWRASRRMPAPGEE